MAHSDFDLNVNINLNSATLVDLATKGLELLKSFAKGIETMSAELDTLAAQVASNTTVVESAIALINGIAQRITDAQGDPAALAALTSELMAEDDALAAAVAANVVPVAPAVLAP